MPNLIDLDDFTGPFRLPRESRLDPIWQDYIDRRDNYWIRRILGDELADLFIADLSNPSQDPRFVAIQEEFSEQDDCRLYVSEGLVRVIVALVYFEIITGEQLRISGSGIVTLIAETSNIVSPRAAMRFAESKRNAVLDSVEAIQWYCREFASEDYPEYLGTRIEPEYQSMT